MILKIRFNQCHRKIYGEKSVEFVLATTGGLIVTRLFSGQGLPLGWLIIGIGIIVIGVIVSYLFLKEVKDGGEHYGHT